MRTYIIDWATNHGDVVEITSHGYDHREYFGRYSYSTAKYYLQRALQPFEDWGIDVKSFCPPYASMNSNTFRAMKDLGFHTHLTTSNRDYWDESVTYGITMIHDAVTLCNGNGGIGCSFKSNNQIISQADERIEKYGYAHISFHMFEFDNNKFNQYSNLLDMMKSSGNYQFMTAEQYHKLFNN